MDNILQKNINISSATETPTQVKIKDENGRTYSFFKKKKDGGSTQAAEQFANYQVGDRTGISYKEVPFTTKDGTSVKLNNILNFMPVMQKTASQTQESAPQRAIPKEAIPLPDEFPPQKNGNDAFGRRLVLHGFVNARLVNNDIKIVMAEIDELLTLEDRLNKYL